MKNNGNALEEKFLSKDEIEFFKHTIINPNVFGSETLKWLSWRNSLERAVTLGNATPEQVKQYDRIVEMEIFSEIICGNLPDNIKDFFNYAEFAGEREKEVALKTSIQELSFDVEDAFTLKEIERMMVEDYEQDLEEPYIQDKINGIISKIKQLHKYQKLDRILDTADFRAIDDKTIFSLCCLILKEMEQAETNNTRIPAKWSLVDKDNLNYLVIKNLKNLLFIVNEETKNIIVKENSEEEIKGEPKNVIARECPADAIREYIEQIINSQMKFIDEGQQVPDELLIPQEIILSPKNIEFLINSKLVDYIGAGETGNEIQFYWKKTDALPALELRAERREDGKFVLSYIKEEESKEKKEFIWDKKTKEGKKGTIVVSTREDALEDIYDMEI